MIGRRNRLESERFVGLGVDHGSEAGTCSSLEISASHLRLLAGHGQKQLPCKSFIDREFDVSSGYLGRKKSRYRVSFCFEIGPESSVGGGSMPGFVMRRSGMTRASRSPLFQARIARLTRR